MTLALASMLVGCSPLGLVNRLSPSGHYNLASGVAFGDQARQTLDIYTPQNRTDAAPVIVFFYGGGWRDGEKGDYEFVASALTEAGYVVVIPDYRLFPRVVFPAFVEDAAQAVSWTLRNAGDYGADTDTLFVMGHSAGAHIAALLSTDERYLDAHNIALSQLSGFAGLSGPYDFLPIDSGYLLNVFPEDVRDASQPVNFVTAKSPPTLLIHGADDDVVKLENSARLARALSAHDVAVTLRVYDGAGHAIVAAALAPPLNFTAETLEDVRKFFDALSASPAGRR